MQEHLLMQYYLSRFQSVLYTIPAVLPAMAIHEYAHGWVSNRLGDPTPKSQRRLSLNPIKHFDPVGALCLLIFHAGWTKMLPTDPWHYKKRRRGIICVALAGPAANMILALISIFAMGVLCMTGPLTSTWQWLLAKLLYHSARVNVGMALFNLLPIPPLDGSRVLGDLSSKVTGWYWRLQAYWPLILLILLASGVLSIPFDFLNRTVVTGMWRLACWILNARI